MNRLKNYLIGLLVLVGITLLLSSEKYLDWLWFKTMNATAVFWVTLVTGFVVKLLLGLLIAAFLLFNLILALKSFHRPQPVPHHNSRPNLSKDGLLLPGVVVSLIIAFFLAASPAMDWTVIQQFFHPVKTGIVDPIFHKDTGFYLFTFPFLRNLQQLLQVTVFVALAGVSAIYVLSKGIWRYQNTWELWFPAQFHLTVLITGFLATNLWGNRLQRYSLLLQEADRITGINYVGEHANLLILTILTWVIAGIIGLVWANLFLKKHSIVVGSLGLWLAISIGLNLFYPGIIRSLVVKPNEYELEAPYLAHHIRFTRQAYNLNRITVRNYQPQVNQATKINTSSPAVNDLRLWDYRPLQASYNQLQAIRPYYRFEDVDIDRYPTPTGQRQVMLAARELNSAELPKEARTSWINLHLTYTHGYGLAANQVNQYTNQGQPIFISRDLPPKATPEFAALKTNRPEIYFGEKTNHYIIVNTRTPEFNYPKGDDNTTTVYQGHNGIRLNSLPIKLMMALKFRESNFILSNQLTPDSQVLMYRNIRERVQKLAPFLRFDQDPYLVVAKGRLYWIIDAYTVSAYYPYARHDVSGLNYIRNSVKTVIDAYNGTVNFYVTDSSDPIIKVWQRVFPNLFKPVAGLNRELIRHFRYPQDLMSLQSKMLTRYHMTNPKTYFAQEDNWDIPVYNENERFEPYYVTLVLPGATTGEFVMMQPFSPRNKQNLSSWLIARCDQPHYGELLLYILPKDQNIYGPAQIDSRINQDQTISQLVTLWNQNQSRVLWGNLLILPIENSILYVKPLFIESGQNWQAELKKVVMVYADQVVLGDTVAEALNRLNQQPASGSKNPPTDIPESSPGLPEKNSNRKAEILQRIEQISRELQQLSRELKSLEP